MTRLNLLPWREARRKDEDRELLAMAVGAWMVTGLLVAYGVLHARGVVRIQKQRNQYLQQQIALVDTQIAKIAAIKKERANLVARMQVIEKLQQTRTEMVHVFDGLVRTIPKGLYLTMMGQKGAAFTLSGVAQSNARISSFMRNLDQSTWFADPNLSVINVVRQNGQRVSKFTLQVNETDKLLPKKKDAKS